MSVRVLRAGFAVFALLFTSCAEPLVVDPSPNRAASGESARTRLTRGAISSPEELSAQIGAEILDRGGNAVDAAIAVQFALSVTHPHAASLGGGGFMLIATPEGRVHALDYRETAPARAHRDMYLDASGEVVRDLSLFGHLAAGVPGSVDGMWTAHRRFGRLPWAELIAPALDLATAGFTLDAWTADAIDVWTARHAELPEPIRSKINFSDYFNFDTGDLVVQPELARTLARVADEGRAGFYEGPVADWIVAEMQRGEGLIRAEDLRRYRSVWREPVRGEYRGYTVHSMPPPSSGGIALVQLLNMFETFDTPPWHSAEQVHLIAEIEKRVFADRSVHLGDPDFYDVPQEGLTSESYARQRVSGIDLARRSDPGSIASGSPFPVGAEGTNTTHFSIVDASGMAVSNTTTLNAWFGCGVVVRGAGFLLNDQMDDFSAKPGVPNLYGLVGAEANKIEPNKRMLSSMSPTIVFDPQQDLWLVAGTPGGSTIFTTVFQLIINMVDYGLPLQQAVDAPRFHHQWPPPAHDRDPIRVESDPGYEFPPATLRQLEEYGYTIDARGHLGDVQAIVVEDGQPVGAADQRRTGFVTYAPAQ